MNPVMLPPGRARLSTKPAPTGSGTITNTIGTVRVADSTCPTVEPPLATMTSGASATNSAAYLRVSASLPADQRVSDGPTEFLQPLQECPDAGLPIRVGRGQTYEHADAPNPVSLLRVCAKRPRDGTTGKAEKLPSPHVRP